MVEHRFGHCDQATDMLERTLPRTGGEDAWEAAKALADCYVRLGKLEQARSLLAAASGDPVFGEAARRMLNVLRQEP